MGRLGALIDKFNKKRSGQRKIINNQRRIDTIAMRIENKKLREDADLLKREEKLRTEKVNIIGSKKKSKKKIRSIRTAPIKNAFAMAKKVAGGTQAVMGKVKQSKTSTMLGGSGSVSPLTQTSGTSPLFGEQKKTTKMRKRRVKIIDYE